MQNNRLSALTLYIIVTAALTGTVLQGHAQEEAEPSLYDRLGGVYSIATVVDDFIERAPC